MSDAVYHAVSGAAGGALAAVVTYPLITLSTRAQIEPQENFIDSVKNVLKKHGIGKLYAGLDSAMYGMTLTNFVYYYFYEKCKSRYPKKLTPTDNLVVGGVAGCATALTTNPIWVLNTQMMISENTSNLELVKQIYLNGGVRAFFKGLQPSLLLVLNPMINYTVYEQLRMRFRSNKAWSIFLLSALSKIIATSITYPLITLKSRLQSGNKNLKSLLRMLNTGLYNGISLKLLQSALQSAFLFLFKDRIHLLVMALIRVRRTS